MGSGEEVRPDESLDLPDKAKDDERFFRQIGGHDVNARVNMLKRRADLLMGGRSRSISPRSVSSRSASGYSQRAEDEKVRSKELLRSKIRGFKEELMAEWRGHQENDEAEIQRLRDDCVSRSVKRSLKKLRQNLFQRRINLAIQEKREGGEFALPRIREELRVRQLQEDRKRRQSVVAGEILSNGNKSL